MNQKFIKRLFISSIIFSTLAFTNLYANAMGFNKNINEDGSVNHNGLVISATKLYVMLDHANPNTVAAKFGIPDNTSSLKNIDGNKTGVVWTYTNAVKKNTETFDANFVFVAGKFKYVTLTNS